MSRKPLTTIVLIIGAAAAAACSSGQEPTSASTASAWACQSVEVPNGGTTECTRETTAAMVVSAYDCPVDKTSKLDGCPPSDAEPAPAPTPPPVGEPSGSEGGGCMDDGDDTDVSEGGDTGSASPSTGDTRGNGNGNAGGGNGNGNGIGNENGNAGGNGNGQGNGGSKHGCSCSTGAGGTATGGTKVPSIPAADAGVSHDAGDGAEHAGGGYHCETGEGTCTCTKKPTCAGGSHPSACGACVPDGSTDDCRPPSEGGCWVTGGGFVVDADGKDTFGGNGMGMKSGVVRGSWEHVDHGTGHNSHGHVRYLSCATVPGAGPGNPGGKNKGFAINQVKFGGPSRWFSNNAWQSGYWFDVVAEDHGEPGRQDAYTFSVRKLDASGVAGPVIYSTSGLLSGGNIQIHPANAGHPSAPAQLPAWVTP